MCRVPSLFASDDCINYYGEYFDGVLRTSHRLLPNWSTARPHIKRMFAHLHSNLIGRVNRFFDFKCPINPLRRRSPKNIEQEWQTQKATVNYFLALCTEMERGIQKEMTYQVKGLEPLIRELPRLRTVLTVIQQIIRVWPTFPADCQDCYAPFLPVNHAICIDSKVHRVEETVENRTGIIREESSPSPLSNWEIDVAWKPFSIGPVGTSKRQGSADVEMQSNFEEWKMADVITEFFSPTTIDPIQLAPSNFLIPSGNSTLKRIAEANPMDRIIGERGINIYRDLCDETCYNETY